MGTRAYIGIAFVLAAVASFGAILPESFEKNDGQWSAEILYAQRNPTVLLQQDRIVLATVGERIELILTGANRRCRVLGSNIAPGKTNYLVGSDPRAWRSNVPWFQRVTYENVYPSIDVAFYAGDRDIEFDVVVHPGGDLSRVRLGVIGAVVRNEGPDVILRGNAATVRMKTPAVYATDGSTRNAINGALNVDRRGRISLRSARYDKSQTLVFDPTLTFSTYLGGSQTEAIYLQVAADAEGHVFVCGDTGSTNFPLTAPIQNSYSGGGDAFISKIDTRSGQAIFTTYLGGSAAEFAQAIRIASDGGVFVAGGTSSPNFPTVKPLQATLRGDSDAFLAKLTPGGDRLEFSTFFGGSGSDDALAMAVDSEDNVFISGETNSSDLPVLNAVQSTWGGSFDGFVAKLNSNGVLYCTYLGGSAIDRIWSMAVDKGGNAYVAGNTTSTDSPLHWPGHPGNEAGFVAKIDPTGRTLLYTKFIGGSGFDAPFAVSVDRRGSAVVAGQTSSLDLPVVNAMFPVMRGGNRDGFVGKVSPDGSRFDFLTYFGGSRSDTFHASAIDSSGNIYVAGNTTSEDFPLANPLQTTYGGSKPTIGMGDIMVAELTSTGSSLVFSTYLGSPDDEWALAIAVPGDGAVYVGGTTNSNTFPLVHPMQSANGGLTDAVVLTLQGFPQLNGENRILPVVASSPGLLGSLYKTSVQLHNPSSAQVTGQLVFHPANHSASDDDPTITYAIAPGATESFADIVQTMSVTGIGSVDMITAPDTAPESVVRMFNDAGELGTTGMTEEQFAPSDVLQAGMRGVLLVTPDLSAARFNIGIRTLDEGTSVKMTVRHADGSASGEVSASYNPNYLVQGKADDFVGLHIAGNDSILFEIVSGSAIIYGVANDNITQDPNLQFVRPLGAASERRVIPVVASGPGLLGSLFKTAVQIHNAGTTPISGRFVFHPQGAPAAAGNPALNYSLAPGQTIAYDNLLTAMGTGGVGTLDIVPESGNPPVSVVRVFNDAGAKGTTGMTEDQITPEYVLRKGERGVLIAPLDAARFRFNIGVRALEEGAAMTVTVRSRRGDVLKSFSTSYEPNYFAQKSSSDLLGMTPDASDSVTFRIDSGSAIVYGATTDNTTQDPSQQVARALTN